jgi:type IV secretion system protein VirD4
MRLLWNILWAPVLILAYIIMPVVWWMVAGVYGAIRGELVKPKPSNTHGNASFATDKELQKAGNLSPGGFMLGVTKSKKRVYTDPEKSALMFAGPGQGKSQTIIAGIMALSPKQVLPHMLVGDAAGEIYAKTASHFQALGYLIGFIDISNPDNGMKCDILAALDKGSHQFEQDLDDLGFLLVTPEPETKQPHFVEFSREVVIAAIRLNVLHEGNTKTLPEIISELLNEKKRAELAKRLDVIDDEKAVDPVKTFIEMAAKPEGTSMRTTMTRKLSPWRKDNVHKLSLFGEDMYGRRNRGWTFSQVYRNEKPVVIFVRQGLAGNTGDVARAVYGNAINAVKKQWDNTGLPLNRPLKVIIDEPKKVGYCKAVVDAHNELRKAKVTTLMPFLSLSSLYETYNKDAETLFNGSDIVLFGATKEMELLQRMSKLVGDYTVESRSMSESDHGESRSRNEQARAVIKPDEIMRMDEPEALMIVGNRATRGLKGFEKTKNGPKYL